MGPYAGNPQGCSRCRSRRLPLAGVVRLGRHEGPLRDLLLAWKYTGREELDRMLGQRLGAACRQALWFESIEAFVPVPTTWRRRLMGRPYPPTAIARELGRALQLPSLPLLRRIKHARSQIGLSYSQRVENVKGAFRLAGGVRFDSATLCLVDDVSTTGATLAECARILRRSGAARVYAAFIAKQEQPVGHEVSQAGATGPVLFRSGRI